MGDIRNPINNLCGQALYETYLTNVETGQNQEIVEMLVKRHLCGCLKVIESHNSKDLVDEWKDRDGYVRRRIIYGRVILNEDMQEKLSFYERTTEKNGKVVDRKILGHLRSVCKDDETNSNVILEELYSEGQVIPIAQINGEIIFKREEDSKASNYESTKARVGSSRDVSQTKSRNINQNNQRPKTPNNVIKNKTPNLSKTPTRNTKTLGQMLLPKNPSKNQENDSIPPKKSDRNIIPKIDLDNMPSKKSNRDIVSKNEPKNPTKTPAKGTASGKNKTSTLQNTQNTSSLKKSEKPKDKQFTHKISEDMDEASIKKEAQDTVHELREKDGKNLKTGTFEIKEIDEDEIESYRIIERND